MYISTASPYDLQPTKAPIEINVCDPEKFGDGMNAYIVYKIKTVVSIAPSNLCY